MCSVPSNATIPMPNFFIFLNYVTFICIFSYNYKVKYKKCFNVNKLYGTNKQ